MKKTAGSYNHNGTALDLSEADTGAALGLDTLGMYLDEIGQLDLLSPEEEIELAKKIEQGEASRRRLAKAGLTEKRRQELQTEVEEGFAARERLISGNYRLVVSIAKRYTDSGVPLEDLVQEGNVGLVRAAGLFDYRRGCRFSTLAVWWIRQAITRSIENHGRTIRLPVHVCALLQRTRRAVHRLSQEYGREPTPDELATDLDLTAEEVDDLIAWGRPCLSLESSLPQEEEDDLIFGSAIEDERAPDPAAMAFENIMRDDVRRALLGISPKEANVLRFRFGFKDGKRYSLARIGRKLGVTRDMVRTIEKRALRDLRQEIEAEQFVEYID